MEAVIKVLTDPDHIDGVIALQNILLQENHSKALPKQAFLTIILHGGLLIAAYQPGELCDPIGFVFGFPGFYYTPDGPRLMHCSYTLGIHPDFHCQGIGFRLKRAQWQMVRHQGIDRITWLYDPLISRSAKLNIAKLGGVCNTIVENIYGESQSETKIGIPSDRFLVDWWINSERVNRRLSKQARRNLDLAHFLAAGIQIINPSHLGPDGLPYPSNPILIDDFLKTDNHNKNKPTTPSIVLVEIPADYPGLISKDLSLALDWRMHARKIFSTLFQAGYLVTDFIYLRGATPRSFYALSHGESTF